ncbi:sodium:proton antiporter NhaD [Campylobacter peloridis]|uniref:Na+/H+ antiporter, NhaD family n=1 Tax=Campylobacter peloridis TaxID=488546 RepID=A0ABX6TTQ3_9BACT|nr:sodium:proton antiporter NhaD [Campylobacter peloridis]AJC84446.1 Na+/H+ antiporter (NhaD family) [Campylobacter peloridis LMG 23910]MBX1886024.1 Na+/H+ antiporter, NhaD family [Campylobacter peloridis]MBX2078648.1 Na+/H+ antiporter, NhaD family [Campylobacter peloridis]QOQ88539.1 Na+/H+ antiporter, NhaD family [Campylobacter peloridis]
MIKILFLLCFGISLSLASQTHELNLAFSALGIGILVIFILGYYFIASEEKYHINKTKPALFIGTFSFIVIGIYMVINDIDTQILEENVNHLILEIAQIVFFLIAAMTFIEALIERSVFETLKYKLVTKGYTYRRLFWLTGCLAFFISPIADNLTTALILSTVLLTIDKTNKDFLIPGAINIVVAANAGGAWSPFGDITTLMVWTAKKATFFEFFALFPASFLGWFLTAYLLSHYVPNIQPKFQQDSLEKVEIKPGGKVFIVLGFLTIALAVFIHSICDLPAMWGMIFGLSLLSLYIYFFNRKNGRKDLNVFYYMTRIEMDTLLFFFGILSAVGALHFVGWLIYASNLYTIFGPTSVNIGVGFLSAIVDNVPVMSAVLKANPSMDDTQWLLVTLTAGIGGSLISFGSAAGVGVMGKMKGIYTFNTHLKYAWTILIGYIVSILIWYIQFQILKL